MMISGRWRAPLPALMWNFGREAGFSVHQINQNSWVLWRRPEIETLAQRIAEGESVTRLTANEAEPIDVGQGKDALMPLLADSLYNAGWRADNPASWRAIALSDLAPEIRQSVEARIQSSLLLPDLARLRSVWLQDRFWDSASLRIVTPLRPPANSAAIVPLRILEIVGNPATGGFVGKPIGALDAP